jgi:hypothetical protein
MKRGSAFVAAVLAAASGVAGWTVRAQDEAGSRTPASLVTTKTFTSVEAVPQGKEFEAAVVVDIAKGYHMNSNKPSEAYLIATTLTPTPPAGFKLVDTMYPPGKKIKFQFTETPLDVYSGSMTVKLKLVAGAGTTVGANAIPAVLRYQACSETTCLPPVKVPVNIAVVVAPAGTAAHPAHPDIFSTK